MNPQEIQAKIDALIPTAESGAQWAELCRLEAVKLTAATLAFRHGADLDAVTDIVLVHDDRCMVASICLGQDADGMARVVLNFTL
jgi:hypothetical protein